MAEVCAEESATGCQGGHGDMPDTLPGLLQLDVPVCVLLCACDVLTGLA